MSVESDRIDRKIAQLRLMIRPGIESFSLGLIREAIQSLEGEKVDLARSDTADL